MHQALLIPELREQYRSGRLTPTQLIDQLIQLADSSPARNIWITRLTREQVMGYVHTLEPRRIDDQPLYGVPFVIKDNIDLAGVPTTAACREYSYVPARSATVVQKLLDAGAIPLGKTNLPRALSARGPRMGLAATASTTHTSPAARAPDPRSRSPPDWRAFHWAP